MMEQGNDSIAWWNARLGTLRQSSSVNCGEVFASAIASHGGLLATSGRFETILWDVASGEPIRRTHTLYPGGALAQPFEEAAIRALAFSPDGKTLVAGDTSIVRLWNVADGSEIVQMKGHTRPIHAVAFAPKGTLLASASEDGTVRLWNMATHKPGRILAHDSPVTSVAFSPNGRLLASGSADGKLRLWRPETGALLLTIQVFQPHAKSALVTWIAYTPEGYYEGSPDIKEVLRWRVRERFFPAAQYERQYHRPDHIQATLQAK